MGRQQTQTVSKGKGEILSVLGGLLGLVYGSEHAVMERWAERLVEQGVDAKSIEGLIQHLGRKQALECVESNGLVGEFCWVTRLIAE
jgi:hypothetical protein